jgi:hypothetical protein
MYGFSMIAHRGNAAAFKFTGHRHVPLPGQKNITLLLARFQWTVGRF